MGFFVKMLSGENENNPSSKRTITFIAFLLVSIGYIAEMFFGKTVNPQTFEMLMYIVLGGMGFTATEKFTNKNKNKDE